MFYMCTMLHGETHVFWVNNLEHHYDKSAKTQNQWCIEYNIVSFVNGSFFYGNNTLIPPFATKKLKSIHKNTKKWWYIQRIEYMSYNHGFIRSMYTYELNPPTKAPSELSSFIISTCPPLIYDKTDISKNILYSIGGKKFTLRKCRRTLIGKTGNGFMFIVVGSGSLLGIRKRIRNKIKDIQWLANLDGGSSTFATVFGNCIVKNKRKIPSIISCNIEKWEN